MVNHDRSKELNIVAALNPAASTDGTRNGADTNLAGYDACMVIVHGGVVTDGTHTPKLQEADDDGNGAAGTYADVAAADLVGSFTALTSSNDPLIQKVGYKGTKKWVRVVLTTAGSTTGGVIGALIVRGEAGKSPVA